MVLEKKLLLLLGMGTRSAILTKISPVFSLHFATFLKKSDIGLKCSELLKVTSKVRNFFFFGCIIFINILLLILCCAFYYTGNRICQVRRFFYILTSIFLFSLYSFLYFIIARHLDFYHASFSYT
jgi:hypothetical protein